MPPHCGNKHLQFCRKITAKTHKSPSTQQGSAQSPAVEERAASCHQPLTARGPVWGPMSTGDKAFSHQKVHFQPQTHELVKNLQHLHLRDGGEQTLPGGIFIPTTTHPADPPPPPPPPRDEGAGQQHHGAPLPDHHSPHHPQLVLPWGHPLFNTWVWMGFPLLLPGCTHLGNWFNEGLISAILFPAGRD